MPAKIEWNPRALREKNDFRYNWTLTRGKNT